MPSIIKGCKDVIEALLNAGSSLFMQECNQPVSGW